MLFCNRIIYIFVILGLLQSLNAQTPTAGDLVGIHVLTQAEINAITNPIVGTLVFNSDNNTLQSFSNGGWSVPETVSTFVDNMDGTFTYTNENNESITLGTIGPQGPKGDKGDTGDTGPAGPPGNSTITNLTQSTTTGIITYSNEDNTLQTANVVSTDANNTIQIGSDGGALILNNLIDVYDANNGYTINNNSYRKILLNTTRLNQGGVFTLANNEVTVSETGTYEIEYGVAVETNAQARVEAKLRVNGVDLAASETYDGGWYKKVTATRKMYVSLNVNDVISIWAQRTQRFNSGSNSVTTLRDGSFLLIKKLD